ncbi:hypothetical protein LCGC14_3099410 [marine sediment metagenome]|uniref:Uncharacterized protein n=1 Tax=marine sediment metagenome TaxID=412755 RepID=A0A0F8YYA3_9ZZZZ
MKKKRDYHARLVIYGLPDNAKAISNWLIQTGMSIEKQSDKHSKRFVAKLMKKYINDRVDK